MIPTGAEDDERITHHRAERAGDGFVTLERHVNISQVLSEVEFGSVLLLDSLTALMQNEMFRGDFVDYDAHRRVMPQLERLIYGSANIVIVSDFIFADAERYDAVTERYRECLAALDRRAAECCDVVLEVASAQIIIHKGDLQEVKL